MSKMKKTMVAAALLAVGATGCKTETSSIRVPRIAVQAQELSREEYVVLGNAEGKACVEQACYLGLFCSVKDDKGQDIKIVDPDTGIVLLGAGLGTPDQVSEVAEDRAMYTALQAQNEADAVFSPRKSMELETTSAIFKSSIKACVRVFGKSIRIKTDSELKGGAPPAPVAPPSTPASAPAAPPAG